MIMDDVNIIPAYIAPIVMKLAATPVAPLLTK